MNKGGNLENKKILFLGTGFYDYERAIINQMGIFGAEVKYYIVTKSGLLFNIFWHIPFLGRDYIYTLYRNRLTRFLKNDKNIYDYIFVIKGEFINEMHFILMKKKHKNATFILYLWDSLKKISGIDLILPYFDKIFSFDLEDVNQYGFIYRPLFFRPEIKEASSLQKKYDVSFVGIVHSDRVLLLRNIRNYMINNGYKVLFKLLIGRMDLLYLLLSKKINASDLSMFMFKKISFKKYCRILQMSKCIVDLHHPLQTGLTIRTIEAFASACFVITTNINIKKCTDIPKSLYYILDKNGENIKDCDINSVASGYDNIKDISYYSLGYFIEDIFKL
jgi:hypothetical protein